MDRILLFLGLHCQFLVSIKRPALDIWKKSLWNDQYTTVCTIFFPNSRSLKRPGLIIETIEYIRVEKYVLALIGSAIWPFQLEKLHSLRKIYSTRFQVIQKIWQMTWWSRNSSSFNFQLHFHPRNCELEKKATPPRTPRISRLKSQILKPIFLS